jgi:hypothetical protein
MKHIIEHVAQRKVVWANKVVVRTIEFAENCLQMTVETPVTSTCLSVDFLELQTDGMSKNLLHTESTAKCIHHMLVKLEYHYIGKES